MPCTGGPDSIYGHDGTDYDAQRKIERLTAHLDIVTALLCELCQRVDGTLLTPEMQKWYSQHKLWDISQGRGP